MHLAHSTSEPPALPFDGVAALLEVEVVAVREREVVREPVLAVALDVVEVVVLLTFATGGLEPPPPQPATRVPVTSADAANRRARGDRISLVGRTLSRVGSASDLRRVTAERFYSADGYRKVSLENRPPHTAMREQRTGRGFPLRARSRSTMRSGSAHSPRLGRCRDGRTAGRCWLERRCLAPR